MRGEGTECGLYEFETPNLSSNKAAETRKLMDLSTEGNSLFVIVNIQKRLAFFKYLDILDVLYYILFLIKINHDISLFVL